MKIKVRNLYDKEAMKWIDMKSIVDRADNDKWTNRDIYIKRAVQQRGLNCNFMNNW